MKKSKEELSRAHKERCKELKQVRAKMAENLGIDLKQRECTYEGYCSGTCLKCRNEELALNAAILKKQMEGVNLKARVAAAGLSTVAAVCLSGCGATTLFQTEGEPTYNNNYDQLEGDVEYVEGYMEVMPSDTEVSGDACVDTECPDNE